MANALTGKSTIVTGAAHGIGLAIARRFVRAGAFVTMADIDEESLAAEVEALSEEGFEGRAAAFAGDLRQKLTMTNLMAATLDAHDGVDILVNACRVLRASEPLRPEHDHLEETLAQNVVANLRLSQIVARRMIELAEAEDPPADRAILNVSSVCGRHTQPSLLAYSVSCAALDQLTRALAVVLAPHRIRVNAIAVGAPGRALREASDEAGDLTGTIPAITPLGRLGEAQEAAEAALFLASASASFPTGHILDVDGGQSPTGTRESEAG